jgi:hypothetical protein
MSRAPLTQALRVLSSTNIDTQQAGQDTGTQDGGPGASGPCAMPEAAKGKWCGGAKGQAAARMRGTDGLVRGAGVARV